MELSEVGQAKAWFIAFSWFCLKINRSE